MHQTGGGRVCSGRPRVRGGGLCCHSVPQVRTCTSPTVYYREITGALSLCAPLILPRERWRRADVTLSIQQQAVHNNGRKSPAVRTCTLFAVEQHISAPQRDEPQQSIHGKRVYHADIMRKSLSPAASTSMLTRLRPVALKYGNNKGERIFFC